MKITIGKIVEFFPNGNKNFELPNGMKTAPAVITQAWEGSSMVNMTVFCADTDPNRTGTFRCWSVPHVSDSKDGEPFWDWFEELSE